MGYSNGKISAPVSIYDIQQALGVTASDLGTLCSHNNINMWAKFKPVYWPQRDTTQALNANNTWNLNAGAKWWLGQLGTYGLNYDGASVDLPFSTSGMKTALETLANTKINGVMNGWLYIRPQGSQSVYQDDYFRILDFLQYNHKADNPIRNVSTSDIRAGSDSEYSVIIDYIQTADIDISQRDYIKPDDIVSQTLYRGLVIYKYNSTTHKYECRGWCTGQTWNGQGIKSAGFTPEWTDGTNYAISYLLANQNNTGANYYVLPVYFTCQLSQATYGSNTSLCVPNTGYKAIAVPFTNLVPFKVYQASRTVILSNHVVATDGSFYAELSVKNTGPSATNIGYWAAVVNEDFTGRGSSQTTYKAHSEGTVNLPSSNTPTYVTFFDLDAGELGSDHTWRVYIDLNGTEYYISLIQPAQPVQ